MSKITHGYQCKLIRKGRDNLTSDLDHFPTAMGYCLDQMRSDRSISKAEIRKRSDGHLTLVWALRNVHHYTRQPEAVS